jgi:predicted amidohydrolase YtcJ
MDLTPTVAILLKFYAARQMGTRNRTGSIERGQAADLIVLDRNPFKIPITQIHETKVKLVMINGEIVWHRND